MPNTLSTQIQKSDAKEIRRVFLRYSLPAIAAMLVNGLYQIVDGIFIGQAIGYQGLAAINMVWPILLFLMGFGIMIGIGAGSLLSIHQGESALIPKTEIDSLFSGKLLINSLYLMLILGLLSSIVLIFFTDSLLTLQGGTGEGINQAKDYLYWFKLGALISILSAALPLLIRNDNSPLLATSLMALGAVLNIAFDYLFILVFNYGLEGAAIATLLAQLIVCFLGGIYFLSDSSTQVIHGQAATSSKRQAMLQTKATRPLKSIFIFDIKLIKKVVVLGASSLIIYLYTSIMVGLHNALFMQYGDAITVGAYAIIGYLMVLYYFIAEGIADGSQPPVSYFFGAQKVQDIRALILLSTKVTLFIGFGWSLILNLFPNELIQLFNQGDDALIRTTTKGIQLHLFALALDGFIMLASIYFTSINQAKKALFIAISNMLIQLPFLYFLPKWLGLEGVWLAMPVSNVLLFLIVAPMVYLDIKKKTSISTQANILNKKNQLPIAR